MVGPQEAYVRVALQVLSATCCTRRHVVRLFESPDPMCFAVANQQPTVRIDEHAVWPVEPTVERIRFWPVTPCSGAEHR